MKRVLLIHYHFLPVHHVGVKHLLGHATHLPASGWEPTVLTRAWHETGPDDEPWGLSWEPDLETRPGVPSIHRVPEPGRRSLRLPRRDDGVVLRKALTLGHMIAGSYPDVFAPWIDAAVEAAADLHRRSAFDAILSYCPPETNVVVGSRLARRLGIPWVVSFGDLYGFHLPARQGTPGAIVRAVTHRYWMRPAARCVAVSPAMVSYLQRTYGVPSELVLVGFDEAEFGGQAPDRDQGRMVISHVGSIYPHVQRPEVLFDGLDLFLDRHPEAAARLVVRLVGTKSEARLTAMIRGRTSASVCEVRPKVASRSAIDLVRGSDALVAFGLRASHGLGTLSYPSKVFEAFAAGRPLLVIGSDGDWVDRLLMDTGGGESADEATGVARVLADWHERWRTTGEAGLAGARDVIAGFTHVAQSRRLAAALDAALGQA